MSAAVRAIATSTPKQEENDNTKLRKANWNRIVKKEFPEENVKIRTDKFKSKVYGQRRNRRLNFPSKKSERFESDNFEEKRRLQAIEAMKIAEQRRLRINGSLDDTLAEDFENLNISSVAPCEYLPDGRIKLTQKQLLARKLKRKRIEEHLAVQNACKKGKLKRSNKTVRFIDLDTSIHTFRPASFEPSTAHSAKNPIPPTIFIQDEKLEDETRKDDDKTTKAENSEAKPGKPIIRYTKDELRDLSHYGYYFM